MSTEKRIWDLIAKKLSGEAAEEELKELADLLRDHPEIHYPMQHVADLWHHKEPPASNALEAFDRHAQRMKSAGIDFAAEKEPVQEWPEPVNDNRRPRVRRMVLAGTAVVVMAIATGLYLFRDTSSKERPAPAMLANRSEVSTKYGSRTRLVLPDGTQVWLNSGSKLSYDKAYGNSLREVQLTGEAYFDVIKNAAHPFVIHAPRFNIKVLGTAFNVRSFPDEKKSETSLIRGSIEVTFRDRPAEKIILRPNEKLVINNEDTTLANGTAALKTTNPPEPMVAVTHLTYVPADSTVVETSWMENKLVFRGETFEDLAIRMERWYGVHIRFASEELKQKKFTGAFKDESIAQALTAMQYTWPFRYGINKNTKEVVLSNK